MLYLDTSAFLKLVVAEEHSVELREAVTAAELWSSALLSVEAHRAGRRLEIPVEVIDEHLEAVTLTTLAESTLSAARCLGRDTLRTLDALHLGAALELGADLDGVLTYDNRLASACREEGIAVSAPGADATDR